MSISDIDDILAIDILGVVPDDQDIIVSTNRGEPVVTDSKSGRPGLSQYCTPDTG